MYIALLCVFSCNLTDAMTTTIKAVSDTHFVFCISLIHISSQSDFILDQRKTTYFSFSSITSTRSLSLLTCQHTFPFTCFPLFTTNNTSFPSTMVTAVPALKHYHCHKEALLHHRRRCQLCSRREREREGKNLRTMYRSSFFVTAHIRFLTLFYSSLFFLSSLHWLFVS